MEKQNIGVVVIGVVDGNVFGEGLSCFVELESGESVKGNGGAFEIEEGAVASPVEES